MAGEWGGVDRCSTQAWAVGRWTQSQILDAHTALDLGRYDLWSILERWLNSSKVRLLSRRGALRVLKRLLIWINRSFRTSSWEIVRSCNLAIGPHLASANAAPNYGLAEEKKNDTNTNNPQIIILYTIYKHNRWWVILANPSLTTYNKNGEIFITTSKSKFWAAGFLWQLLCRSLDATMIITQIITIMPEVYF